MDNSNGNTNTAARAMEEALSEITKLWNEGETRITHQELDRKRDTIKNVVSLSIEYLSILGKFDAISNNKSVVKVTTPEDAVKILNSNNEI